MTDAGGRPVRRPTVRWWSVLGSGEGARASPTIATIALRTSSPVRHSSGNASRTGVRWSALTATMSKP